MARKKGIKPAWIVCEMSGSVLFNPNTDEPQEFSSEKAAIKRAGEWTKNSDDSEAWVFRLSHVVRRPDNYTVEPVK